MSKPLVIVESPAKARTLTRFLGKEYNIMASMGHIRDLPSKTFGIDLQNNFAPEYKVSPDRKKVISELKKFAEKADTIFLAPDPDREGEAIAWHLMEILKSKKKKINFKRVTFHEITKSAILNAFNNPTEINTNLVDAQQARRILDRIVGYKVSPELWRNIGRGLSAGRVQSVALKLICKREREINAFVPKEYWNMEALFKDIPQNTQFNAKLALIDAKKAEINNAKDATFIENELKKSDYKISDVKKEVKPRRPGPPLITSTLQQLANSSLRMGTSLSMRIAQQLYEGIDIGSSGVTGLITYMRTDSVQISKEAMAQAKNFISTTFGNDYIPTKPNFFKSKKTAQEAHEAIRPTDVKNTPEKLTAYLSPQQLMLYRLIWKRFVASQMAAAKMEHNTVDISSSSSSLTHSYTFKAHTVTTLFSGYMKVLGNNTSSSEAEQIVLTNIQKNDICDLLKLNKEQKFTEPPKRFTEGTLVKELEANGVGRPSTYASIINTLYKKYVEKVEGKLVPEAIGFSVNDFLEKSLEDLFKVKFTAEMEDKLDAIESGDITWTAMLDEFYNGNFKQWIEDIKYKGLPEDEVIQVFLKLFHEGIKWEEPVKFGKRTFDDKKLITSFAEQLEKGKKLSTKQWETLLRIATKYSDQIDGYDDIVKKYELNEKVEELKVKIKEQKERALALNQPPDPKIIAMLSTLVNIKWDEPTKRGKRVYDDKAFYASLLSQAESGRKLSDPQINAIKKIIAKYSTQISNFEEISKKYEIALPEKLSEEQKNELNKLFKFAQTITNWEEPKANSRRRGSDKDFYISVEAQFKSGKRLSDRQVNALKKLLAKYKK